MDEFVQDEAARKEYDSFASLQTNWVIGVTAVLLFAIAIVCLSAELREVVKKTFRIETFITKNGESLKPSLVDLFLAYYKLLPYTLAVSYVLVEQLVAEIHSGTDCSAAKSRFESNGYNCFWRLPRSFGISYIIVPLNCSYTPSGLDRYVCNRQLGVADVDFYVFVNGVAFAAALAPPTVFIAHALLIGLTKLYEVTIGRCGKSYPQAIALLYTFSTFAMLLLIALILFFYAVIPEESLVLIIAFDIDLCLSFFLWFRKETRAKKGGYEESKVAQYEDDT